MITHILNVGLQNKSRRSWKAYSGFCEAISDKVSVKTLKTGGVFKYICLAIEYVQQFLIVGFYITNYNKLGHLNTVIY